MEGDLSFLNDSENEEVIETLTSRGLIISDDKIDISSIQSFSELKEELKPWLNDSNFQEYVRQRKGVGVSDDIACSTVANFINFNPLNKDLRHYISLSIGAYIADFIDTISKTPYLYVPSGLDNLISEYVNKRTLDTLRTKNQEDLSDLEKRILKNNTLIDQDQLVDLIALSKNPDRDSVRIVHSSSRYFLERQQFEKEYISSYTMEQQ